MRLLDKISSRLLARYAKERAVRSFVSWDKLQRVQFVYNANIAAVSDFVPLMTELYKIRSVCKEQGKAASFVIYAPVPVDCSDLDDVTLVTKKQCSLLTRRPPKQMLAEYGGYDADLLINLSPLSSYPVEFFAAVSAAKFKVAAYPAIAGAKYDFMYSQSAQEGPVSALTLFKGIKFYLEQIRPADDDAQTI